MTFTKEWADAQNRKRLKKLQPTPTQEPDIYDAVREYREQNPGWNGVSLVVSFTGQIMGGKNNIIVTRTGHRFPNPKWAKWRDKMVASVKQQLPVEFRTIDVPTNIRLTYWAGDKRRRDMPAIVDAIFHVLEKAGVVEDDTLLWVSQSSRHYDKDNPGALVGFL